MDAWKALPDDLKKILKEAMMNFGNRNKEIYAKEIQIIIDKAGQLGYEVITLPDKDVAKIRQIAIDKIWSAYAKKSPECAKAIEAIKKFQGVK